MFRTLSLLDVKSTSKFPKLTNIPTTFCNRVGLKSAPSKRPFVASADIIGYDPTPLYPEKPRRPQDGAYWKRAAEVRKGKRGHKRHDTASEMMTKRAPAAGCLTWMSTLVHTTQLQWWLRSKCRKAEETGVEVGQGREAGGAREGARGRRERGRRTEIA